MSDLGAVSVAGGLAILGTTLGSLVGILGANWLQTKQRAQALEVENQRINAESEHHKTGALRSLRRERLGPLFAVMEELQQSLANKTWSKIVEQTTSDPRLRENVRQKVREAVQAAQGGDAMEKRVEEKLWDRIPDEMMAGLETDPKWITLTWRAVAASLRISDARLRADVQQFAMSLQGGEVQFRETAQTLGQLYDRLEVYASVVEQGDDA